MKSTNAFCGQNSEFINVKAGGTYREHCALKCWNPEEQSHNFKILNYVHGSICYAVLQVQPYIFMLQKQYIM
jgi:hypothetical protein